MCVRSNRLSTSTSKQRALTVRGRGGGSDRVGGASHEGGRAATGCALVGACVAAVESTHGCMPAGRRLWRGTARDGERGGRPRGLCDARGRRRRRRRAEGGASRGLCSLARVPVQPASQSRVSPRRYSSFPRHSQADTTGRLESVAAVLVARKVSLDPQQHIRAASHVDRPAAGCPDRSLEVSRARGARTVTPGVSPTFLSSNSR